MANVDRSDYREYHEKRHQREAGTHFAKRRESVADSGDGGARLQRARYEFRWRDITGRV